MQKKKNSYKTIKTRKKSCEAITVSLLVHLLMRTQTVTYERELHSAHVMTHVIQ